MTDKNATYSTEDMEAIRASLENKRGVEYWRSLEEVAQTPSFQEYISREFPGQADMPATSLTRRNFLQVMGASLAFAGVTAGCARQPTEYIYPYVKAPEEIVPGKPMFYASAFVNGGYAYGVLVESHMGRPTKIEGLPNHPASLGATDVWTQASVLDMYDPDRARIVQKRGNVSSWEQFVSEMQGAAKDALPNGGEGLRILTESITSPTLAAQLNKILEMYPRAKWHQYEPVGRHNEREGAKLAAGEYFDTRYNFDQADVVVSLDADFLYSGPGHVRYAHDFAKRRDVSEAEFAAVAAAHAPAESHGDEHGDEAHGDDGHGAEHGDGHGGGHGVAAAPIELPAINRLYAFESSPTVGGAMADHLYPVKPTQVEAVARVIAEKLGVNALPSGDAGLDERTLAAVDAIVADLERHRRKSVVVAGSHQPPVVHALAHAINNALGNVGATVEFTAPVEANPINQRESIAELVADMNAGAVNLLVIAGGNPLYNAPSDLNFADALNNVETRVRVGRYEDETARYCHWMIPESHYLEAWGDARAYDGTVSLVQPLIAPMYDSKTLSEVLSVFIDATPKNAHDILKDYWRAARPGDDFDTFWGTSLSLGVVENTSFPLRNISIGGDFAGAYTPAPAEGLEVVILPDPSIGDGTFSNNAWLQEVPKPLSKITWDNAIIVAPSTARRLGLSNEGLAEVTFNGHSVKGPVWIQPSHAQDTITLHLGFGRKEAGKVGNNQGFDVYPARTTAGMDIVTGAEIKATFGTYPLARTEEHFAIEGRALFREVPATEYAAHPSVIHDMGFHVPAHYETLHNPDEHEWHGHRWGLSIDLNKCIGCNACIVACQSENIIPVVGKTEVMNGREMQWIRVDRYYETGTLLNMDDATRAKILDKAKPKFQPLPCMQCEAAPCEVVCPVGATMHSKEGLNDMVYNRCIGTRFCSNNCPYKVRRFNFYHYSRTPLGRKDERVTPWTAKEGDVYHVHAEELRPMRNPDVTVRTRGVMEKCTYCVQRINSARIESKKEGRPVRDGEVVTACQQACPSKAITFGDLSDPESKVAKLKETHRNYGLLEDLNTRPRTTYLAKLSNPNEEIEA